VPKLDLIVHPIRLRLIQSFSPGDCLTANQLATRLPDIPPATLYRHLGALVRGAVLRVVELRPVRAAQEKVYSLIEGAANVGASESRATATADHLRHFTVFLGLLRGDFERYVRGKSRLDLARDGVAYYQIPVYLSDAEHQRFVNDLKALLTPLRKHEPNGSRQRRLVNIVTIPGGASKGKPLSSNNARRLRR
jgi:hypothetical protein